MATKNKKLLDKSNSKNTIVHVAFNGKFNEEYECVGVLIKDEKNFIRIAFNAKNDKVIDYLDIKRSDIISINVLASSDINKL